uniref:Homeobox domain-containing protein n=1 Tax=Haemonchus placei TaxID=6290 RepID=A0A0N4WXV6_HAEPC
LYLHQFSIFRCSLVFQRYYELIQHQQKKCYKDDCQAQANDNKIVEESLTDEEKAQLIQQTALASINDAKPADLAKLLGASKSSTEALLKLCESANTSPSSMFHKRCPFCGLLFRSRQSLQEHIPARHPHSVPLQVPCHCSRDTLSMSPFLGQSDDDPTEFIEENPASYASGSAQSRSPTSNKRYRTHLTPTQVHVMKSVFGDYKTPSMTECEALGREIGLHKRVVQVWFQNARAKERKTRTASEVNRSTSTSCTMCGVEYGGRITLQDHLFSLQHLNSLKAQLRVDTAQAETTSTALLQRFLKATVVFSALPLVYDPAMFGTPVAMLQIPESVKMRIKSDITVGWACPSCTNVFQQEALLKNHQRTVCQGTDYSCRQCD